MRDISNVELAEHLEKAASVKIIDLYYYYYLRSTILLNKGIYNGVAVVVTNKICKYCGGSGNKIPGEDESGICPNCLGEGFVIEEEYYKRYKLLGSKINFYEKVDKYTSEYFALSSTGITKDEVFRDYLPKKHFSIDEAYTSLLILARLTDYKVYEELKEGYISKDIYNKHKNIIEG